MPLPYPFWDAGLSYGILMAFFAVVHVFVSHFAIGGGLYLVVMERAARKANDTRRLEYLQKLTKFFVLVTVVFGALTGVGIWFIIGLLNPVATEALIHNFVWGWAIEWTFFVVEILAAILYFYGWKHMSAKGHMKLGWAYFGAAWLSLFVINGIITFMLTPGAWIEDGSFWSGFFNPTFWSSLVLRTGIALLMAGLFTLFVASRLQADDFKARLVRTNAVVGHRRPAGRRTRILVVPHRHPDRHAARRGGAYVDSGPVASGAPGDELRASGRALPRGRRHAPPLRDAAGPADALAGSGVVRVVRVVP